MSEGMKARWRRNSTGSTSRLAAESVDAKTQAQWVLAVLEEGPATPETITARIANAIGRDVLLTSIRPRCSQLAREFGRLVATADRGRSEGGRKSIVYRLAEADELSLFLARKAAADEHGEVPHG